MSSNHSANGATSTPKYIFVTGGVVSSLGKGIAAASLGRLLVERGFRVTMMKLEAPLAALMVLYTTFGLWLLATPAIS